MEMRYLEQLIMFEKSRSIRDAAEKLFVSQAALSHNLKKLEAELDCQLFTRTRNQLTLNAYGRIMLEYSRRIIAELEEAKRRIAEEKLHQAQTIRIGVYACAFQNFVLPNLANTMRGSSFVCRVHDCKTLLEGLAGGSFDLIFTAQAGESDALVTVPLFQEQIMVSLPSSSPYAARQSISLPDLANLNIFLPADASGYTPWFEQILKRAGTAPAQINFAPLKEYLYSKGSVEQCHLTSSFILRFLPAVTGRVSLPLGEDAGTRDIYMIYKKQDEKRLAPLLAHVEKKQDQLFSGSAFLPFFLFPEESNNLLFRDDAE